MEVQVLFIGQLHGKNKPQLSYPGTMIENDNSINNIEDKKQYNEFQKRVLSMTRERLQSIVKRPKRSGSKVVIFTHVDYLVLLHGYIVPVLIFV